MRDRVAIIWVSYHSTDDLGVSLASARSASTAALEFHVVNNAPGDPGIAALAAAHPDVSIVEAGDNLGYGRAVNLAAAGLAPEVDWILIVNPDTEFEPGSIDELLRVAGEREDAALFGPRIIDGDGSVYPSARALPSLRVGVGHALFARFWPNNRWSTTYRRSDLTSPELSEPRATGWLSGACLLIRRSVFDAVGGFDDRYFMYFEDVDLGRRVGETGAVNLYVPSARMTHVGGQSTKRHSRTMIVVHHRSAYLYLAEKYHGWYLWPLRAALRVGLAVRARISSHGAR